MLKKLRIKFICINMVFLMGMLCVVLGLIVHFTQSNLEAESLRMMEAMASRPFDPKQPDHLPERVHLPCFTVRQTREGRLTAEGGSYYDLSDEGFLEELVEAVAADGKPSGILEEYGLRYLLVSAPQQSKCFVFADISSERSTLTHLTRTCILGSCLEFLAFLFLSFFLARWAVRPVERAWDQQRQFIADASHELKTPLTVIITNAELLQGSEITSAQQPAGNILAVSRQMRGLVENLLELARMDGGAARREHVPLDLSQLVSDAVLPFEAIFFERGLTLAERLEDGVTVRGDPARLRQTAEILLDNAQKYSAPGGTVTVSLERRGRGRCLLSVSSPGQDIPQEELVNIFKRFYRLDKARSRNGSYGLGLSIAWTIVSEHHGRIWAESGGGRNTFQIELPAEAKP